MQPGPPTIERICISIRGAVQGVGFRPTVYRLASSARLGGWVRNTEEGLEIEAEGTSEQLDAFLKQLELQEPSAAQVLSKQVLRLAPRGTIGFEILSSTVGSIARNGRPASVLPDLATCPECLSDTLDQNNRRYGYAFTNCTLCGPRYSIQRDIPYDRPNTTMKHFRMCTVCRGEYDSFADRRFHAQPNACPVCGPRLQLWPFPSEQTNPVSYAAAALAEGKIVALKGIGGYQLLVNACNEEAVRRLRERKQRSEKPFALLMSSIDEVEQYCVITEEEKDLLLSQAAPIVLLEAKAQNKLAGNVSHASPRLGVMLPCSPLHHLLTNECAFPLVATSGNLSGEPIAIDDGDAVARLKHVADLFLLHNRPIARPCDDSVVRVAGGLHVLRRSRGYAPLPVQTPCDLRPVLAVGGHLKSAVAITLGRQVFLSQHIGDLDSFETRASFARAIDDLSKLFRFQPEAIACDLHPDYASTRWAQEQATLRGLPLIQVQHHHAHIAACAAENGLQQDYLGVAWDGTGLGLDQTIWGGEFFLSAREGFERIAHLRKFPLPGGEAAIRDCSRSAAGILWTALDEDEACQVIEPRLVCMLQQNICTPITSSVGRLFDAVAYLTGVATRNSFEGQAAMRLESAIDNNSSLESYEIGLHNGVGDWSVMLRDIMRDKQKGTGTSLMATKFHNALANWLLAVARTTSVTDVVLSGGVFQNAYLTARATALLCANGFRVHTHHQIPANDGGLAFGQAVLAGQKLRGGIACV